MDRTAGGARKSEERVPKAKKDINPLFHKKINVDIFAAAVGGLPDKNKVGCKFTGEKGWRSQQVKPEAKRYELWFRQVQGSPGDVRWG